MRLLIVTQTVNLRDSDLGFFHRWLEVLARHADLCVIANYVGEYKLPPNVSVYSLGKEKGSGRIARFFRYRWLLLKLLWRVDGIFYHMCPEYVLAAGFCPMLFRKRTLLWYVHKSVTQKLRIAEKLVSGIFTASQESFRAPSKKVQVVGHGIDTEHFVPDSTRVFSGIQALAMGRITSIKDTETLIRGMGILKKQGVRAVLDVVGEPRTREDAEYLQKLRNLVKELGIDAEVRFLGTRAYEDVPEVYRSHNMVLHASRTGSLDKVVLEALACGVPVFTSSEAYGNLGVIRFPEGNFEVLAEKLVQYAQQPMYAPEVLRAPVARDYSLERLIQRIVNFYQ